MGKVIVWFKSDLRLHDNYVVERATGLVRKGQAEEVLPLYCFDPRQFGATPWGNPKTGNYRAQFILESVQDLKRSLRSIGSDLVVKLGQPEDVIPGLLNGSDGKVITQAEFADEELTTLAKVQRAIGRQTSLERLWDGSLHHKDDLPFKSDMQDLPDVFTPFRNKVESKCQPREPVSAPRKGALPLPSGLDQDTLNFIPSTVEELNSIVPPGAPQLSTPQHHPNAVLEFKGGESVALQRLQYYLWDSDLIADYFNTRNGMLGGDYSTKFSPWLAHGCISPRRIAQEISKYESQRSKNKSTYWVTFELLWRDFFRFFMIKHGTSIFQEGGTTGQAPRWVHDEDLFQRWKEGRTGMPLVDANMRELKETGFMSNRGRQNVASYLILDLGIDWRKGADWFESVLADYDVASNWGNWVAAAGLTGGRVNHFNIIKQSKDYDMQGKYVKAWIPELGRVPQSKVHQPWTMSASEQAAANFSIGQDYPTPPKSRYSREHEGRGGSRGHRGGRGDQRGGGRGGKGRGKRPRKGKSFPD